MSDGQYQQRDGQHFVLANGKQYTVPKKLHDKLTNLKVGQTVQFELENGTVSTIKPAATAGSRHGQRRTKASRTTAPNEPRASRQHQSGRPGKANATNPPVQHGDTFLYPYNFVPFHTEDELGKRPEQLREQEEPCWQDRWRTGGYSGKLQLRFETKSPLLNVEYSRPGAQDEPDVYRVRTGPDGSWAMAGSNLKGMLRVLYEQATGSRLGVFSQKERLTYREDTKIGNQMLLAEVLEHTPEAASLTLRVLKGLRPGSAHVDPLPVRIPLSKLAEAAQHGTKGAAWLRLKHEPGHWEERKRNGKVVRKWQDERWSWTTLSWGASAGALQQPTGDTLHEMVLVEGKLHQTGKTFPTKKHERLMVSRVVKHLGGGEAELSVVDRVVEGEAYATLLNDWRTRIGSMSGEESQGGGIPIYAKQQNQAHWKALDKGQTLFVRLGPGDVPDYLSPGMITRGVDKYSPADLLIEALHPASTSDELSAADRVFGWVAAKDGEIGKALRGKLRVGAVVHEATDEGTGHQLAAPITLSPLGAPQPTQGRFYTRSKTGRPLNGINRRQMYDLKQGHTLSGFKVFPTQYLEAEYWEQTDGWSLNDANSRSHPTGNGHYRYFLAAKQTKKKVTFAIDSWVPIGEKFSVTVYFDDLNRTELAALLWIIDLPDGCHRLGMGKPLGFGSIKMDIDWDNSCVRDFNQTTKRYALLDEPSEAALSENTLTEIRDQYDAEFRLRAPKVYCAMVNAAKGYGEDVPVHYGWVDPPVPQAEGFHYFVLNERGGNAVGLPTIHDNDAPPKLKVLKKHQR